MDQHSAAIGSQLGLELEMPLACRASGASHLIGGYFGELAQLKAARALDVRTVYYQNIPCAIASTEGESGLDNGFNLLETAFAPVAGGPGGLQRLAQRVQTELGEAHTALAAEGAVLLNAAEHPDCTLDESWYRQARVPRPIYRELVGYRRWLHRVGIDAKAQNSPCTAVPVCLAVPALNAMLALAPALIAIFANSPLECGRDTGWQENRLSIWPRVFGHARFAGDFFLQRLPPRPFRDLGDHYRWMFGAGTVARALPAGAQQSYKNMLPLFLQAHPSLERFLMADSWLACQGLPSDGVKVVRVSPRAAHFFHAQYAHFLDARWRYSIEREPDIGALRRAWRRDGGIEELLEQCGASGYIEGRAPGALLPDPQLIAAGGARLAAGAVISPSALQLGLLRALPQAESLWREWGWARLARLRAHAMRQGIHHPEIRALAREVLAVARGGLAGYDGAGDYLAYADFVVASGQSGADRLLQLWRQHAGAPDRLAQVVQARSYCAA